MQRRVALLVVLVIGVTIFVTSSSVFAQQGGGGGSPLAAIQEQLNSIQSIVQSTEDKIDDPATGLDEIKAEVANIEGTVGNIESVLVDPTSDLTEIKNEILSMKTSLTNLDTKMNTLNDDILFIKAALTDPATGLVEIKAEVANIETTVGTISTDLGTANTGIGTIQTEILSLDLSGIPAIQATLDDPDNGLGAIQTEILSLDLSGIAAIQNILDDPTDDAAEPNNIQMIKNDIAALDLSGIATIQNILDDPNDDPSEPNNIQMIKDTLAAPDIVEGPGSGIGVGGDGSTSYSITLENISDEQIASKRSIVLGIFSDCGVDANDDAIACPFTVDEIFLRPKLSFPASHPTMGLICSDDVSTSTFAPRCRTTLSDGGSLTVGAQTEASAELGTGHVAATKLAIAIDFGPSYQYVLPFGEAQPLHALPKNLNFGVSGSEAIWSQDIGSVPAKKFVTAMFFQFSGKIEIAGTKLTNAEITAVTLNFEDKFGTPKGTVTDPAPVCDDTCKEIMRDACFGRCKSSGNMSFDLPTTDTPIINLAYSQNKNHKSNTVSLVSTNPPMGSTGSHLANTPKPVQFEILPSQQEFLTQSIQNALDLSSTGIDLPEIVSSIDFKTEINTLTSSFDSVIKDLGIPDLIGRIDGIVTKIDETFTTLDQNLATATDGITSVSSGISGIQGDITKIKNDFTKLQKDLGLIPASSTVTMCPSGQILNTLGECESLIQAKSEIPNQEDDSTTFTSFQPRVLDDDILIQTASGEPTPVVFDPTEFAKVQPLIDDIGTVRSDLATIIGFINSLAFPSGGTCPADTTELFGVCTATVTLGCDPAAPLLLGTCTGAPFSNCPDGTSDPERTGICTGSPRLSCPSGTDRDGDSWRLTKNSLGVDECQRDDTDKENCPGTCTEVNTCAPAGISCSDCGVGCQCFDDPCTTDTNNCQQGRYDITFDGCVITPTQTCDPNAPNIAGTCTGFPNSKTCPNGTGPNPDSITGLCTGNPTRTCPPDTTDNGTLCTATPS